MKCGECGKSINEETSRKFFGLCKECYKELVVIFNEIIIRRVRWLCENRQPIIRRLENGEPYYAFYLPTMVKMSEVDSGKPNVRKFDIRVDLGQAKLNKIDNLVGMGGFYYNPEYYWGESTQSIVEAWNWFVKEMQVDEDFWEALEGELVWETLLTGYEEGLTCDVITLVVDLHALNSLNVDVSAKISEIKKQIRDHMDVYEKLSKKKEFSFIVRAVGDAFFRVRSLRLYLNHLSSESRLARLAKLYGFDVKLEFHPDMTINGKNVEVKKVRKKYMLPKKREAFITFVSTESTAIENLSNPISEGLRQNADIIAIEVDHLNKRSIKGFKSKWLSRDTLKMVLTSAITYNKKGIVMLFSSTSEGDFGRIILVKERKKVRKEKRRTMFKDQLKT